ncbi:2-succinyl-6-hydroxy-2,4-cyclohexadiene-1-carboxylate synthase [Chloroflexus islandicus]|uniref:Putative 2-succinyl-6-hydroxy-2,4-cyclohexadiene-1-carboxylate synthase n=1 Tax=Chloroflexus islandicus TaxID=1707952 RepID=A0A178MHR3_9CHLR|nr:2-succinyl-6-hydroxy-2,4-cyclohexadiene-1-carboxylate synthase [Chloroflexus islandicus]OAN47554.1 2-succinyl-6-hydroxy-2,4-cyclohexadiene-1-carboxylate synthase [Chloroflexus islandicus]
MKISLNDLTLHVALAGAGPPLLLLHGFTGNGQTWQPLVPSLAAHHTLVMVDLIGHGQSDAPADPARYAIEQCVADVLALIDQLSFTRVDLCGYSMGGRIGLLLAAGAPERVGRQVLIGASPGLADPAERAARLASDEALAERIEREGLEWFVEYWAAQPLFASQRRLPAEVRAAQRAQRLAGSACGYANALRGMSVGRQPSLWAALPAIATPTLLITGALDEKFCVIGAQMAALMPHARHVIVPDAGHAAQIEQPAMVGRLISDFLAEATD